MTDKKTIQLVVLSLAVICIIGTISIAALAFTSKTIPDAIGLVTSTSLGGLAALLAHTSSDPTPNPIPTVPTPPSSPRVT